MPLSIAWIGFTINLLSGVALFTSDAVYFWGKYVFRIKLILIVLGGINAFILGRTAFRQAELSGGFTATSGVKWVAATSLLFWLGAVVAGRLIAYVP